MGVKVERSEVKFRVGVRVRDSLRNAVGGMSRSSIDDSFVVFRWETESIRYVGLVVCPCANQVRLPSSLYVIMNRLQCTVRWLHKLYLPVSSLTSLALATESNSVWRSITIQSTAINTRAKFLHSTRETSSRFSDLNFLIFPKLCHMTTVVSSAKKWFEWAFVEFTVTKSTTRNTCVERHEGPQTCSVAPWCRGFMCNYCIQRAAIIAGIPTCCNACNYCRVLHAITPHETTS